MKRITSFILAILMLSSTFAYSEGLLPSLTDTFGVDMPSMAVFLERKPDEETTDETGTVTQVFYQVSENDFDGFNKYLEENGCALADYSVSGNTVTETIEKQGKTFSFTYDNTSLTAIISFPLGTNPEIYDTLSPEMNVAEQPLMATFSSEAIQTFSVHTSKQPEEMTVGDYIKFGRFEQDNILENGAEEIIWRILDIRDGRALLISEYALDYQPFEEVKSTATWENCSLRYWLNDTFYNSVFSVEEQESICESYLPNLPNRKYGTFSGNVTVDRVFQLSSEEANNYLNLLSERDLEGTDYLRPKQHYAPEYFWLRSAGENETSASIFSYYGSLNHGVFNSGASINSENICIRPCIWVTLNNAIMRNAEEFTYLYFGAYEQDDNLANGKEPIEWIVVELFEDKALLVSRWVLDTQMYNAAPCTWGNSNIRQWLNTDFLNTAFSEDEQIKILGCNFLSEIPKDGITDKVFLLSESELLKYLPIPFNRRCEETTAVREFINTHSNSDKYAFWATWLRSPNSPAKNSVILNRFGKIDLLDYSKISCVRPAVWIDLG